MPQIYRRGRDEMEDKTEDKTARWSEVEISIAGKNVTTALAPYLISISVNDKLSAEVDDLTITLDDRDEKFISEWWPERGDAITASIICYNREQNNQKETLNLGTYEIDLVTHKSSPASTVEIKAVATFNSRLRKEIHTHKWENTTLYNICKSITKGLGMKLSYEGADVDILLCDQTDMTDLQFLAKLGEDNDFVIKIVDNTLYIAKQTTLEKAEPVTVLSRKDFTSCSAAAQAFDLYKEAIASYWVPHTHKPKSAKAIANQQKKDELKKNQPEWYAAHSTPTTGNKGNKPKKDKYKTEHYLSKANIQGGGKILHIRQRFNNEQQAKEKALAALAQKNRGEYRMEVTLPGHPLINAGSTIYVVDYGRFEGKYFIDNVTHSKTKSSGFVTTFSAHMCLGEDEIQ